MSTDFITVGTKAKKAALVWLHEVQEHEDLLRKSISHWPEKTYQLAVHIQQAIGQTVSDEHSNSANRAWLAEFDGYKKRIAELEEKQRGYTQFAFATGEAAAKRELRITELEAIIRNVDTVRDRAQRITELEKEAALLTIQLTSLTETKNIIEERIRQLETQLEEHEDQNNQLVRAYANLQQAAFKLGDTNNAMGALLDRVPHRMPHATEGCLACTWEKLKLTGLAGQTPSNPGGGATGTPGGCSPKV